MLDTPTREDFPRGIEVEGRGDHVNRVASGVIESISTPASVLDKVVGGVVNPRFEVLAGGFRNGLTEILGSLTRPLDKRRSSWKGRDGPIRRAPRSDRSQDSGRGPSMRSEQNPEFPTDLFGSPGKEVTDR